MAADDNSPERIRKQLYRAKQDLGDTSRELGPTSLRQAYYRSKLIAKCQRLEGQLPKPAKVEAEKPKKPQRSQRSHAENATASVPA